MEQDKIIASNNSLGIFSKKFCEYGVSQIVVFTHFARICLHH